MGVDLLIKDGLIIHTEGARQEDIRISDEHFTVVESNVSPEEGEMFIDAKGKFISGYTKQYVIYNLYRLIGIEKNLKYY